MTGALDRSGVADRWPAAEVGAARPPIAPRILNARELSTHGLKLLRDRALRVAAAGLGACDVQRATEETVSCSSDAVSIGGRDYALRPDDRVVVLGSGKATLAIAVGLERQLGERLAGGAVVVRAGDQRPSLRRIDVLEADHPLPTERSVAAARRLVELADGLGGDDLVLASFTGGSSALASLPPRGVTPAEKRRLHELLLASGAPISDVNAVRKHVSALKGGRLAERIAPARIVNLTVSDVAGDVLDAITDPTVADASTVGDAISVLRDRGLWGEVPESIQRHLGTAEAASPALDGARIDTVLLATGGRACKAMTLEARAAGLQAHVLSTTLEGEARELGRMLANLARESHDRATPFAHPCVLVGCGGEATVSLRGEAMFGAGGPNQEAAVSAALALADGAAVAAVFLDTDGSDGGTDAAGAIADGLSLGRARSAGVDLGAAIAAHRSHQALAALDDLVFTGATGTNVNDLFVLAVGAGGE